LSNCGAGLQVNLLKFDPLKLEWTDLTGKTSGPTPSARGYAGFAAANGKLYMFGGYYDFVYLGISHLNLCA
jgi:hypothetical protein